MRLQEKSLATAIRIALASAILASAPTYANEQATDQDPAAKAESVEKLEKIQVTGSRLRGIDVTGASPLQVITRDDIEAGGFDSVSALLDSVSANNGALPETWSGGFSDGAKGASLRSLGVNRTLTLINGRRVATYGFAENLSSSFVDLNSISLGAVERVEVLLDGASSVYGSDAITGVINIILREDFEGNRVWVDVSAPKGGGETLNLSYLGGVSTDKANFMANINFRSTKELTFFDRGYSKDPLKSNIDNRSLKDSRLSYGGPGSPLVTDLDTGARIAPLTCASGERYTYATSGNTYCLNYYDQVFVPERQQLSAVLTGNYNLDNGVELFSNAQLSVVDTTYKRSQTFAYSPDSYLNVDYSAANFGGALPGLDPSINNAAIAWQMDDLGMLEDDITTKTARLVTGARGTLDVFGNLGRFSEWDWETAAGFSTSRTKAVKKNQANKTALMNAAQNYEYFYLSGVDLNALTGGLINVTETNSQDTLDKIRTSTTRDGRSDLYFIDFNTTGTLFELPAGDVNMVVGSELRWEKSIDTPDQQIKDGDIYNFGGTGSAGSRQIQSLYAETNLPITETVEAIASVRHEQYSDFGGSTNPGIKLRYQPMDELLFRASWGTGFRAPSIAEKYTDNASSFILTKDTTRCNEYIKNNPSDNSPQDSQYCRATSVNVKTVTNPDLGPENSQSFNLGMVLQPTDTTTISVDAWQVEIEDVITELSVPYAIENEDAYGDFIDRDPASDLDKDDNVTIGSISSVTSKLLNVDKMKARGLDLEGNYTYDNYAYGTFSVNLKASYLDQLETESQYQGIYEDAGDFTYPRWKARVGLNWVWQNDHSTSLFANYRHHYTDTTTDADSESVTQEPLKVNSRTTFDLSYQYTGFKDVALQVGVTNLFNKDPSFSNFRNYGAAIFTDDVFGRTIVGSIGYTF